jgi:hypothetical protein
MASDDQWQIFTHGARGFDHFLVESSKGVRTTAYRWQIAWAQIGDRGTDRARGSNLVTKFDQRLRCHRLTMMPWHATDEVDSGRIEEVLRQL